MVSPGFAQETVPTSVTELTWALASETPRIIKIKTARIFFIVFSFAF